jgi:glycosyltransferase involved in cell wall biosynthesis
MRVLMADSPELSVVIPCRNVAKTLGAQLEALTRQQAPFPWEVIVVDNGSTDDTVAVARSFSSRLRLRVVPCSTPGLNVARNTGIRAAAAEFVALCDGDDVVADGWVEAVGSALRDHPYVTGPLDVKALNPPALADSRGGKSGIDVPRFGNAFSFANGCNMGIRRQVLADAGWFDEHTPCLDDQELGLRLHVAGVPLRFVPEAVVQYRYRSEPRALWSQGFFYGSARVPTYLAAKRAGLDVPGRLAGWRSWAWLVLHLPRLRTSDGRLALLWIVANRLGQVRGSIRWRTVFV